MSNAHASSGREMSNVQDAGIREMLVSIGLRKAVCGRKKIGDEIRSI
jgi:hypothetical protein